MTGTVPQRFPTKRYLLGFGAIIVVFGAPMWSVLISTFVASANGCVLNEAEAHPCVIAGIDFGETLVTMFVAGWLALITLPIGTLALGTLVLAFILHLFIYARQQREREKQ